MGVQRMDHVGIIVDDLAAAQAFFVELGLKVQGEGQNEGEWVDRIVGLEGVRAELAMMETPDGRARIELVKFHAPASPSGAADGPAHALGLRHITFAVENLDDVLARLRPHGAELVGEIERGGGYRLCYIRGPEGIIIELAEKIDSGVAARGSGG